jgi:hypothetical protein
MNQVKVYYKSVAVGVAIGVLTTGFFFAHTIAQSRECEPVVDVEYNRAGKKQFVLGSVVRKPVRDGDRCLLAEAGS